MKMARKKIREKFLPLLSVFIRMVNPIDYWHHLDDDYHSIVCPTIHSSLIHSAINLFFTISIIRLSFLLIIRLPFEYCILFFDMKCFQKIDPIFDLFYILIFWALKTIEYSYYNTKHRMTLDIIRKLVFHSDKSFFNLSNKFIASNKNIYRSGRTPKELCRKSRLIAILLSRFVQIAIIAVNFLVIFWQCQLIYMVIMNRSFFLNSWLMTPVKLIISESMFLCLLGSYYATIHYLLQFGLLFLVGIIATRLRFQQLEEFLLDNLHNKNFISLSMLKWFRVEHTKTVRFVSNWNSIYSKCFTMYLIANIPFNLYIVIQLLFAKSEQIVIIMLSIMASQQFIGIFGAHLLIASIPHGIHHRSILHLISLNLRLRFRTFREHLKLINYNEKFHTKKPYGLTYYRMNLITTNTFLKCIILYIKSLSLVYKIFMKNH
nr:uncharacterized protein LOC124497227 [Dermatophagoides farinae]